MEEFDEYLKISEEQPIFYSPINYNALLDEDDLITDVKKQINYLKNKNLKIIDEEELIHIIENYGFNRLIRKYSTVFVEEKNGVKQFKGNTSEKTILSLFYLDYELTNILADFLGTFEHKFTSNIINQINIDEPKLEKQLDYLYDSKKSKSKIINNINKYFENGSYYLKPFINQELYPAWVILGTMTLGEKCYLLNKLKNDKKILMNFYLENFNIEQIKTIVFDFIRPFRNICAHFDRLMKFTISLNDNQYKIFKNLIKQILKDKNHYNAVIENAERKIKLFNFIVILIYLIGKHRATQFLTTIYDLVKNSNKKQNDFDVNDLLINKKVYNFPENWQEILKYIVDNKI